MARECLPEVERFARGIDYDSFVRLLSPLLIFAPPLSLPAEKELKTAWFKIGHRALCHLPAQALEEAITNYIATSERSLFPSWGKLGKLAEKRAEEIRKLAYRVKLAAQAEPPRARAQKTPEEKAAVEAMLADFLKRGPAASSPSF